MRALKNHHRIAIPPPPSLAVVVEGKALLYYVLHELEATASSPSRSSVFRDALARSGNYADDATTQNRGCTTTPYFR